VPGWLRRRTLPIRNVGIIPADVIVRKEGDQAVAIDGETKEVIARSSDHAEVIQAAINKYDVVYIKKNKYEISDHITLRSNIVIFSNGAKLIRVSDLSPYAILYGEQLTDVEIYGIVFDGNKDVGAGGHIIHLKDVENIKIRRCKFINPYNYGIWIKSVSSTNKRVSVIDNVFVGSGPNDVIAIDGYEHIIALNKFYDVETDVYAIGAADLFHSVIFGNVMEKVKTGIGLDGGSSGIEGNIITSNDILDPDVYAIFLNGKAGSATAKNNIINGNLVWTRTSHLDAGIYMTYTYETQVIGNIIRSKDNVGYGIYESDAANDNVIAFNHITRCNVAIRKGGANTVVFENYGYKTINTDVAIFSGDGTTTQFKVEHSLSSIPSKIIVTPLSADAKDFAYATADDTYIYFNFSTAPPSGTDNVKLSWYAEV